MGDTFEKNLDSVAEYQSNHLTCWASVALTAYRAKFGKSGKGASVDSLLSADGGSEFKDIYDFCGEVEVERANSLTGDLETAAAAVRKRLPKYTNVPHGLGSLRADAFFKTFLRMKGMRVLDQDSCPKDAISGRDKLAVKALIKASSPIVIFTKMAGGGAHLRLIHGYWDGGDANSPQIMIWDPEARINEVDKGNADADDPKKQHKFAKSRLLWPHFQQQVVKTLLTPEVYYY
jgi:hypothetical protein